MPDVNWDTCRSHSSDSVRILNFLINHGFEQLVTLPTHINGNTLDLIFVNFSICHISEVGTGITDFFDRFLISFQCYFDNKQTHLSNCNHKVHIPPEFYSYLQPFTSENYTNDWLENFAQLLSLYYRKKRQKRQNAPFYYSSHTMHLLNVLNTAKRRCEKYHAALNLRKMSAIARDVNISIKLDTAVFVDSFTKRHIGLNGCFKLQKRLKTSNVPNVMIHNDVKFKQNVDIAEAFNAFFASVFKHKTSAFSDFSANEVNTLQITQNDVFDALYLSTPSKGHDGISGDFLKICCSELSFHVYKLFQSVLNSGIYPEIWKLAKIIPVFKSGKKQDVTCYRPISLLSKLFLSFERVIFKKLYKFIAPKLFTRQFGFLKGRSTITQLLLFFTEASYANEKNNDLYAFYLDFAKAFHSAPPSNPHETLTLWNWRQFAQIYPQLPDRTK